MTQQSLAGESGMLPDPLADIIRRLIAEHFEPEVIAAIVRDHAQRDWAEIDAGIVRVRTRQPDEQQVTWVAQQLHRLDRHGPWEWLTADQAGYRVKARQVLGALAGAQ